MSVTDLDRIDLIATRPGSTVVKLIIADHLRWANGPEHLGVIQDKINAYLGFLESGALPRVEEPPIPAVPDFWITLAVQHAPPPEVEGFFSSVDAFLGDIGLRFEVRLPRDPNA